MMRLALALWLLLCGEVEAQVNLTPSPSIIVTALAANYTNATTSYTSTNLTSTLAASTTYQLRVVLTGNNSTASDGAQCTINLSASGTYNVLSRVMTTAATASSAVTFAGTGSGTIGNSSINGWTSASNPITSWMTMDGVITMGAAGGTMTVQCRAVTAGTVTVNALSYLAVQPTYALQ